MGEGTAPAMWNQLDVAQNFYSTGILNSSMKKLWSGRAVKFVLYINMKSVKIFN